MKRFFIILKRNTKKAKFGTKTIGRSGQPTPTQRTKTSSSQNSTLPAVRQRTNASKPLCLRGYKPRQAVSSKVVEACSSRQAFSIPFFTARSVPAATQVPSAVPPTPPPRAQTARLPTTEYFGAASVIIPPSSDAAAVAPCLSEPPPTSSSLGSVCIAVALGTVVSEA